MAILSFYIVESPSIIVMIGQKLTQEYYTNVTTHFGKILYRGYKIDDQGNRHRVHGKMAFKPTAYLETKEVTPHKSLFGGYLKEKQFDSIPSYRHYVKQYGDMIPTYGWAPGRAEYEFIARALPNKLEFGIGDVVVGVVDIETTTDHGKIDTINSPEQITLITYQDYNTKALVTFGFWESTAKNYIKCSDEADMLRKFVSHVKQNDPDILTGWNTDTFDLVYIINRGYKVLQESEINELSPFGIINIREKEFRGKIIQEFDIVGRASLDLLALYKKFTFKKRDNYKLDTIAKVELGLGKLENPYKTFREFYTGECDIKEPPNENAHDLIKKSYIRSMMRQELIRRGLKF